MALDGCSQICKCILILFNTAFGLLGFAMVALGLWLRYSSETKSIFINLNTQQFVTVIILLIVLGTLMVIISILGNCAACSENRSALAVFCFMLGLLAGAEIAAGVLTFQNHDEVGMQLSMFYQTVYLQYVNTAGDPSMSMTLMFLHKAFECCGIVGRVLEPIVKETCPYEGFLKSFVTPPCPTTILNIVNTKASAFL